ncbi:MAG: single-stranded DNA-binding protein [Chloroflexi bacterium]|nr:single-stranded DNA-binding protein [Chloroflexota bacterium]|tara:strand:- start:218 stop:571 length:354 start_codon:yes stop_codon:yes gene_type:complete
MNLHVVMGHVGADPEVRTTTSGKEVMNFRVATNRRRKEGDRWVDETDWHSVVYWEPKGLVDVLRKGSQVLVRGESREREWTHDDGTRKWKTELHAFKIELCGGRPQSQDSRSPREPF